MNTRKLILSLIAILGVGFLSAMNAYATIWYVRDGGGTPVQCTGTSNAVYPGSGTNQDCAISHPAWIIGGVGVTPLMAGGDTLDIIGDSDVNPGQQARYMIGYGMPNTTGAQCATAYAGACFMNPVPGGTSSTNLTKVIGIGTHQPQLWGTQAVGRVLDLTAGNYDIENLEITQHSSCNMAVPSSNPGFNGYPSYCGGTSGNYPYGTWAQNGIYLQGTNITTKNLWIHNIAESAIYFPGNVTNWNSTSDKFVAAGQSLTNGGSMTFGGNNTQSNDVWAFGGCAEKYPLPDPGNVKDLNNYLNCCDQNCSSGTALGGGFVMQYNGNASCGNWTISDSQFLFNLKSNIDFLHCNGTGTFNIYRSRSEGSTGEALKLNVATVNIEQTQLIGNAPVWSTAPFKAIMAPYNSSGEADSFNLCRGNAVAIFAGNPKEQVNLLNDDVTGNCTSLVEVADIGQPPTFACTGMSVNARNTKFISGYGYDINEQTNLYYVGGDDGNGSGACGSGTIPFNENYDSVYNELDPAHCTGANSLCTTDPKVVAETSSALSTILGPASYYSGTSLGDQLYLQSSSALRGTATTDVTLTNGSANDYNNYLNNSPPDIGAEQYGTCVLSGGYCSQSSQCCNGGTCSSGGQCAASQPIVSITTPASGSSFTAGSNVSITTTASETNGTIADISLYNGAGILLGTSSISPYRYMNINVVAGTYTYVAVAMDAYGVSVTSSPITVTVMAASIPPSLPVVSITNPASGSSFTAGANVTIAATASESNGTISNISIYNGAGVLLGSSGTSPYSYVAADLLAGSYTYTAKVTDALGISVTSSPVTITVTPPPLPVVAITSPFNASSFTAGSYITITAAASETNGSISKVTFYNGSTLLGTAASSPYSYTWNNVTAGNYNLTAIAYDNNNNQTTSIAVAVAVHGLPVVNLASNNASFTTPASIILTAAATEANGAISKVAFYNGSSLLGTVTSSPYRLMWINVPSGNYSFTAIAYDSNSNQKTSTAVAVMVHGLPVVNLTSNNTSFTAPASVILTAAASETNGTITKVAFYNGATLLGTAISGPYSFTWNNVAAGSYSLTSVATDSSGATASSSIVSVTVTAIVGPTVSIATPVNNASYTTPANLILTANASEANRTISQVSFYNGSILLGTVTSSPYRLIRINAPAGTYSLTARATDSAGVSTTSAAVTVKVSA